MLQQFLNHIQRFQLGDTSTRVLLAVSGGLDSMVMLHLYHTAGFEIGVAHCNFQLRGKASDDDAALVKATCDALQIPFYIEKFDTNSYAIENGLSIQMAARELRYRWFEAVVRRHHYEFLATAHHLNDSIETVLLSWINGGSLESFSGIPVKNNYIIRPLLFASREALTQYALASNVVWREDQSNFSDDYERNYIRHHVIPHLKELNPSLEQTILRSFEKTRGEIFLTSKGFDDWKSQFVKGTSQRMQIDKKAFDQMIHAPSLLWRLLRALNFNFDTCRDIAEGLDGQSGKKFLSPTHQLVVDREELIVTVLSQLPDETIIAEGQRSAMFGNRRMDIEELSASQMSSSPYVATLDASQVRFPVRWRRWRAGDVFYPLGMNHRKKISDFLIDNKVPVSDKENATVLESAGEIIWVAGYRIDNRFKVTESTSRVITFSLHP